MEFEELAGYLPALTKTLREYYRSEKRTVPSRFRPHLELLEEYTMRGGKRLRALLVLAGFHIASGRDPSPALPAAAALEMFQSWMLIHDDIIDHAEQRRGGIALHRAAEERHRRQAWAGRADDYGVGMGITLGDLQEPLTVRALLDVRVPAARRSAALAEYVDMTRWTAYGQILDIENGLTPVANVREQDVLLVHRLKSAVYTVAAPLRIGARLGGGYDALLEDLLAIGHDLGVAFQLRDDLLGAGFDAGAIGKSANDLAEGKRTLLVVVAWARGDASSRALIDRVLGDPAASPADVEALRAFLVSSGSVEYSEKMISRLNQRAQRRIRRSRALNPDGRALLDAVSERLLYRKS